MIFGVIEGLKQWRSVSQFQMCSRYSRTHWLTSAGSGFDAAGSMLEKYPVRLVCTSTSFVSCKVALFAHFETCLSRAPALPKKKKTFSDRLTGSIFTTGWRRFGFTVFPWLWLYRWSVPSAFSMNFVVDHLIFLVLSLISCLQTAIKVDF